MSTEKLYTPFCIYTYGGLLVDVMNLDTAQVFAEDIAFGLARECRFGNHTKKFWSVADHSIWCMLKAMELYPDDRALHFRLLMHDAHEAYLGDWCTPIVESVSRSYGGFKEVVDAVKSTVQQVINKRFGISTCPLTCEKVKAIDRMALEWEWRNKVTEWRGMNPIGDKEVAEMFLHYFSALVTVPVVLSARSK